MIFHLRVLYVKVALSLQPAFLLSPLLSPPTKQQSNMALHSARLRNLITLALTRIDVAEWWALARTIHQDGNGGKRTGRVEKGKAVLQPCRSWLGKKEGQGVATCQACSGRG